MNFDFHVHDDTSNLCVTNIPLALWVSEEVYIMQEDRIVFISSKINAINWIENNKGIKMPKYWREEDEKM